MEHKFEHHWGGEEMWYQKAERWANQQKFPINHLALGLIQWLKESWIDGKVEMEMNSVDRQAEEIKAQWDEQERNELRPIVEETVSGVEGLPTLSISNPVIERRTQESGTSMGTWGDASGLGTEQSTKLVIPDPWDYTGDQNDAQLGLYNEFRRTSEDVAEG